MALEHSDSQMRQSAQENTADADYEALITRGAALRPRINVALTALLGEGSFGAVYEASWRDGRDEQICVKCCRIANLSNAEQRQLRREVCLHAELSHPNLNALVGAWLFDGHLHVVLHRCAGDLATALAEGADLRAHAPRLLRQLLLALAHLHERHIAHHDVKPSNLLLDGDGTLQLCDLGAAARVPGHGRSTLVGSPAYLAPEAVAITHLALQQCGAGYSTPADVWSAGIVLVELLSGRMAFPASPLDAAAQPSAILFRPPTLEPAEAFAGGARTFVLELLQKQPFARPSAEEALRAPYLAGDGNDDVDDLADCLERLRCARELLPPRTPAAAATPAAPTKPVNHSSTASEAASTSPSDDGSSPASWCSSLVHPSPPGLEG